MPFFKGNNKKLLKVVGNLKKSYSKKPFGKNICKLCGITIR